MGVAPAQALTGGRRPPPRGVRQTLLRLGGLLPLVCSAAVLLLFYLWLVRGRVLGISGDEPSYLALARAIAHHSLDVRAAYHDPAGPRKWLPGLTPDQVVPVGHHLRSIRLPLLPLVMAPAAALSSLTAVRLTMVALGTIFYDQLWRLLGELGYRSASRIGAWLAALTALPVLAYSTAVFPEVPAALLLTIALRGLVRGSRGSVALASLSAGLLPWLIVRFLVLGFAVVAASVLAVLGTSSLSPSAIASALRRRWSDVVLVVSPFLTCLALWLLYSRLVYGNFDVSHYPPGFTERWTPWNMYTVGFGSLLGQAEGLLPYAPALTLGVLGSVRASRRFGACGWILLASAWFYLLAVTPIGFFGLSYPGRFALVLVPLLTVAAAELLRSFRLALPALVVLVGCQLTIIGLFWTLLPALGVPIPQYGYLEAFPVVTSEPGLPGALLRPPQPAPTPTSRWSYRSQLLQLRPGHYICVLTLRRAVPAASLHGPLRVTLRSLPSGTPLARRSLDASQASVALSFTVPPEDLQWTNVQQYLVTGPTGVSVTSIEAVPRPPLPPPAQVIHDGLPLGLAWAALLVGGAVVLGWAPVTDRRCSPIASEATPPSPGTGR